MCESEYKRTGTPYKADNQSSNRNRQVLAPLFLVTLTLYVVHRFLLHTFTVHVAYSFAAYRASDSPSFHASIEAGSVRKSQLSSELHMK